MRARTRELRRFNPDGNERLTSSTGLVLIVLALAEIATLLIGLGSTLSWHVAVGLALIPPIALKLASTGWRFVRYYTRNAHYRERGAPQIVMRTLAPLLVAATIALFGSGVAMGVLHGHALQLARSVHGPASVVWLIVVGLHVLVYLRHAFRSAAADVDPSTRREAAGARLRGSVVGAAVAAGLILALVTLPDQHPWLHLHSDHHARDDVGVSGRAAAAAPRRRTCEPLQARSAPTCSSPRRPWRPASRAGGSS
jgi:hypothetical protein